MTTKVGIYKDYIVDEISPSSPKDVKTAWGVIMPQMYDVGDCIQIDKKYLLSIGAHDTHQILLLSAKYTISYLRIMEIANLISYLFDTICYIGFPDDEDEIKTYFKGLHFYFKLIGHPTWRDRITVEERISNIFELSNEIAGDGYLRLLPYNLYADPQSRCCSCDILNNVRLKRALAVYRQALLSTEPQGMILNYWRVLEAVTSKSERYDLIRTFLQDRLKPIKCFKPFPPGSSQKPFNLISRYRRSIKGYFSRLLQTHNTPDSILDHLYKNRRNPSAHANTDILEVTTNVSFVSLYRDALLLKYLSRCAIERFWDGL